MYTFKQSSTLVAKRCIKQVVIWEMCERVINVNKGVSGAELECDCVHKLKSNVENITNIYLHLKEQHHQVWRLICRPEQTKWHHYKHLHTFYSSAVVIRQISYRQHSCNSWPHRSSPKLTERVIMSKQALLHNNTNMTTQVIFDERL